MSFFNWCEIKENEDRNVRGKEGRSVEVFFITIFLDIFCWDFTKTTTNLCINRKQKENETYFQTIFFFK